jgi:ferric-dicitrate binding protein FerR (iron transport regulator)
MAPKEVISDQCSVISRRAGDVSPPITWRAAAVVARSPDHATALTEALLSSADSGDLRSTDMRGQETRAQLSQETRAQRRRRAPARDRRGVLILVVLSLLILFVVIAVMFVVVASRARAVARVYSDVNRTGDTPEEIVYGVALDLIRG